MVYFKGISIFMSSCSGVDFHTILNQTILLQLSTYQNPLVQQGAISDEGI